MPISAKGSQEPTRRPRALTHTPREPIPWGHLRYTLCLIRGSWRDHGPRLDALYLAATDQAGGLVSAFGPLGPIHKEVYLDGDRLRTPIPLAALTPFRIPPIGERGWLTLDRLVHPSQIWLSLATYYLQLEHCVLHLTDDHEPYEPPTHVVAPPTPTRLRHIRATAI
ncbi:MAG TPA: hypothetical protein VNL71_13575 [Chloroflexota bacterium]|nr:hypothetical protein [Chloroflexota bacterium]